MFAKLMIGVGVISTVVTAFVAGVTVTAWVYGKDPERGHKLVDEMAEALAK